MTIERIQWTCPVCQRRYMIPASAPKPSRCPQCRQSDQEIAFVPPTPAKQEGVVEPAAEIPALAALAAIQNEVVEEAAHGHSTVAPAARRDYPFLRPLALVYTVLAALAAIGAFAALLFGLRAAFVMELNAARTVAIFEAIGFFVGGLVVAVNFFTLRELIYVVLDIEENTRRP
jgi:hypothetical protein